MQMRNPPPPGPRPPYRGQGPPRLVIGRGDTMPRSTPHMMSLAGIESLLPRVQQYPDMPAVRAPKQTEGDTTMRQLALLDVDPAVAITRFNILIEGPGRNVSFQPTAPITATPPTSEGGLVES